MRFFSGRVIIGLFIIIIGVLMLLDRLGYGVDAGHFWSYWPVIPLLIGINWLLGSVRASGRKSGERVFFPWGQFVTAIILIIVGVLFLGSNLGIIDQQLLRYFWRVLIPVIIIFIGFNLIWGKAAGGSRLAIIGGIEEGRSPWKLESSSYLAFMGGVDLDITTAEVPEGETVLDLTAVMGGIDVKIPPDLPVVYEGSAVLGGVIFLNQDDGGVIASRKVEHNIKSGDTRLLRIQARAILGGIDVKEK